MWARISAGGLRGVGLTWCPSALEPNHGSAEGQHPGCEARDVFDRLDLLEGVDVGASVVIETKEGLETVLEFQWIDAADAGGVETGVKTVRPRGDAGGVVEGVLDANGSTIFDAETVDDGD